ncbi:hypothetical protein Bca52824_057012 [Brassica carinata]|uniref:Uncharacterized protein n=1 Tax=Brassica carinata TaxID=52824 RepID=A0A8X7UDA1_BRACI|nr:hypothetical protein Bca52824_057012 [Brassica carinata]
MFVHSPYVFRSRFSFGLNIWKRWGQMLLLVMHHAYVIFNLLQIWNRLPKTKDISENSSTVDCSQHGLKLPASGFGSKELRDQEAARKNRIVSRQKQRDDAWGAD